MNSVRLRGRESFGWLRSEHYKTRWSEKSYTGGPVKAESNSTSDTAFTGSVRTDDHVKMRTRTEFDMIVSQEVVQLNANDGSWDITTRKW